MKQFEFETVSIFFQLLRIFYLFPRQNLSDFVMRSINSILSIRQKNKYDKVKNGDNLLDEEQRIKN